MITSKEKRQMKENLEDLYTDKVYVYSPTESIDSIGASTPTFTFNRVIDCFVENLSARDAKLMDVVASRMVYRLHTDDELSNLERIVLRGDTYDIISVHRSDSINLGTVAVIARIDKDTISTTAVSMDEDAEGVPDSTL